MVRGRGQKYIHSTEGHHRLYHLATDPDETHDLLSAGRPVPHELSEALQSWRTTLLRPEGARSDGDVDPRVERRLKDLGYF